MSDKIYTTAQAATFLGVARSSVIRYIRKGKLSAEKHGWVYIIKEEELERFREKQQNGTEKGQSED